MTTDNTLMVKEVYYIGETPVDKTPLSNVYISKDRKELFLMDKNGTTNFSARAIMDHEGNCVIKIDEK